MAVTDVNDVIDILKQNQMVIEQYIQARITEVNLATSTQIEVRDKLNGFSKFVKKNLKDVTRDDVNTFLNSLRKSETDDPVHKWIGTYNHRLILISTFLRWFYYPKLEHNERPRPDILLNIKQLKRKEKSTYKPSDMWTQEDDVLFLKYCPSKRDKAYHAISRDLSCRPHELLKLKIKDVVFKRAENGQQYAEIVLNGKTGTRPIPLIKSVPYVKDWLDSHPLRSQQNAYLICQETKFGTPLSRAGLYAVYRRYQTKLFPSLLKDPQLNPNDKEKIQELLYKPWNLYIRRHSGLTEKSKILTEHTLRQYAGWSPTSNMHQKYIHYFGNESSESLLENSGLINRNKQEIDKLMPRICPNCKEINKIDSRFCVNPRCRMVLTIEEYMSVTEENRQSQSKIETLEKKIDEMLQRKEIDYERLDAKIDQLQREFYHNNIRLGRPGQDPECDWEDMQQVPDEEIERDIRHRRVRDKHVRERDERLIQELIE